MCNSFHTFPKLHTWISHQLTLPECHEKTSNWNHHLPLSFVSGNGITTIQSQMVKLLSIPLTICYTIEILPFPSSECFFSFILLPSMANNSVPSILWLLAQTGRWHCLSWATACLLRQRFVCRWFILGHAPALSSHCFPRTNHTHLYPTIDLVMSYW